jgi:hypothetical protein
VTLEGKLNQLVEWIQDPSIGPEKRFQLLQEIAEEAARYKLGGDDKIRVAGGACDGVRLLLILNHRDWTCLTRIACPAPKTYQQPPRSIHSSRLCSAITLYPGIDHSLLSTTYIHPSRCPGTCCKFAFRRTRLRSCGWRHRDCQGEGHA